MVLFPPQKSASVTTVFVTLQRPPPLIRIFAPGFDAPSSTTTDFDRLARRAKIAVASPAAPAPTMAISQCAGWSFVSGKSVARFGGSECDHSISQSNYSMTRLPNYQIQVALTETRARSPGVEAEEGSDRTRALARGASPLFALPAARELVKFEHAVMPYRRSSRSSTRSAPVDCAGAHTATAVRSPHDPQRMMSVVESCDEPMICVRLLPQRGHSEEPVSWRWP